MNRLIVFLLISTVSTNLLCQTDSWCNKRWDISFPSGLSPDLSIAVIAGDDRAATLKEVEIIQNSLFDAGIHVKMVSSSLKVLDTNNLSMIMSKENKANADIFAIVTVMNSGNRNTLFYSEGETMFGRVNRSGVSTISLESLSAIDRKIQGCYTKAFKNLVK
mgnify:CR=1 FL=1